MNKKETSKIIAVLMAAYPNFLNNKTELEIKGVIDVWETMLIDFTYQEISVAIKMCISQNADFAPSIGKVIEYVNKLRNKGTDEMTEIEAWGLVRKAVSNSAYNSESEFNKLPKEIQNAIGSHNILRNWSQESVDGLEKVIGSNFMRSYKASLIREKEYKALPQNVKNILENIGGNKLIGDK